MAKTWCISRTAPIIKEVAEKYNISKEDARVVINTARGEDTVLNTEDLTVAGLEASDAFKRALAAFTAQEVAETSDLFATPAQDMKSINDTREEIRKQLGLEYTAEEVEDLMNRLTEIPANVRLSKKSSRAILKLIGSFKDPRHLDFLGNFVCRQAQQFITQFETNGAMRKKFNIQKHERRIDYFRDPDCWQLITDSILDAIDERAELREKEGKTELANELLAINDDTFSTLLYMYGGRLFREEGIEIGIEGIISTTDTESSDDARNDVDEEGNEMDKDNPEENPVNSFSVSEQNKSVTTKIAPSIKILISSMYNEVSKGKVVLDPYGYRLPTFVDTMNGINQLYSITAGCFSYEAMIDAIKRNVRSTPWLRQLVEALEIKTENDTAAEIDTESNSKKEQLQTMFYQSMRKQVTRTRVTYATYDQEGLPIFISRDVNVKHRADLLKRKLKNKFNKKRDSAMFAGGKINFNFFQIAKQTAAALQQESTAINSELRKLRDTTGRGKILEDSEVTEISAKVNDLLSKVHALLKDFGVDISKQVLADYAANSQAEQLEKDYLKRNGGNDRAAMSTYIANYNLQMLLQRLEKLSVEFDRWHGADKANAETGNPFIRNTKKKQVASYHGYGNISGSYNRMIDELTAFSGESIESQGWINGERRYFLNNPSSVQTILEHLTDPDIEARLDYLREKYGKDKSWFLLPGSRVPTRYEMDFLDAKWPKFYAEWIGEDDHEYSEKASFCGTSYNAMTDAMYALSIMADFFQPINGKTNTAWYRMHIASDKPRYSSISGKRYRSELNKNFRGVIADKAINFFAQELRRSRNVVDVAVGNEAGITKVDNYDIPESLMSDDLKAKIKAGKVKRADVLNKNGRYIFRQTGASFFLCKFINDEIEDKDSKLGKFAIDIIFNNSKYKTQNNEGDNFVIPADKLKLFREGFHKYMANMQEEYVEYLKGTGLFQKQYVTQRTEEGQEYRIAHLGYLWGSMQEWHAKEWEDNKAKYKQFVYYAPEGAAALAEKWGESIYSKNKQGVVYENENKQYYCELYSFLTEDLPEFMYNNWLAKANMSEMFDVDLAFYGNTTSFQKRNAQIISAGYAADKNAKIHGEKVSDGKYRTITLATEKDTISHELQNLDVLLHKRAEQITDPEQRARFEEGMEDILNALTKIDPTDGQSFTSLTGLRKRMAGQGNWSRSNTKEIDERGYTIDDTGKKTYVYTDEAVYQRMKRGYRGEFDEGAKTNDLLHVFAQVQKPFVYAFTNVKRGDGYLTVPIQHKNSEYALISMAYFLANEKPDSKIAAIAKFMEETAANDPQAGIDVVNFDSAVKIGGNNKVINLSGMNGQQAYEALHTAVYGERKKARKKYSSTNYADGAVTDYDCEDYKIIQLKPEHFKRAMQSLGSQMKILSVNNINDATICTLPDGKQITGKELKSRYFKALKAKTRSAKHQFRRELGLGLPTAPARHFLSNALKSAMSTDQKFTADMRRALSITSKEGNDNFVVPLDEVGQQGAIEASLYSKIRRVFYKQRTQGGIVVQATSWGGSKDLHIRFYSSNEADAARGGVVPTFEEFKQEHPKMNSRTASTEYKKYLEKYQQGYAWFEMEAPMPDHVRAMLVNKDGSIDSKYYNTDGSWNMEEIKKTVPEKYLEAICYRIPTEAKYSMMVCKIVRFANEAAGSTAKYPLDLTEFTGADFDIDTDTVEMRPGPKAKQSAIDDEIFDLQLAALRSQDGLQETFKRGDFSDLQELSYKVTLIRNGVPAEGAMAMSFKQAQARCMQVEDLDLMNPMTDVLLHNQNTDAKDMIAIAAVGVTSHAFMSLYNDVVASDPSRNPNTHPENFLRIAFAEGGKGKVVEAFTVTNDKNPNHKVIKYFGGDVLLDMMHDMDGQLISTSISKYVGASADAAKDAAEYRLNINKTTLPILVAMHRMGVSSEVARLFISQPVCREAVRMMSFGRSITDTISLSTACDMLAVELCEKAGLSDNEAISRKIADSKRSPKVLVYSELMNNIANPENQTLDHKLQQLHLLSVLAGKGQTLRTFDSFTRYNSSKSMSGSTFIDRYFKKQQLSKLRAILDAKDAKVKLPQDVQISEEYETSEFGRLCTMFPYIADAILAEDELAEEIILENMHTYNAGFFEAVEKLFGDCTQFGVKAEDIKSLYVGWKNYLLFVGPNRIAPFDDMDTAEYIMTGVADDFDKAMEDWKKDKDFYSKVIEHNTFLNSIYHKQSPDGYAKIDVLSTDINGLSDAALEKYQNDWAALFNYPQSREIITDITIHFLARAAGFNRDTPVAVMPLAVKEAIPNYLKVFEDADKVSMSEEDIMHFIELYQRHNSTNKNVVPQLFVRRTKSPSYGLNRIQLKDKTGNDVVDENGKPVYSNEQLMATFYKERSKVIVDWTRDDAVDKNVYFKTPIISLNGELFKVDTATPVTVTKAEKDTLYSVPVTPVSKLGIPNVMMEYVGYDSPISMFDTMEEGEGELMEIEAPVELSDTEGDITNDVPFVNKGATDRVGTIIELTPMANEEWMNYYGEALIRHERDRTKNRYIEGRTFLKRARRTAEVFGFNRTKIQRAELRNAEGKAIDGYSLTVSPNFTGGVEQQHQTALELASVLGAFAVDTYAHPSVKTYVSENQKDKANAVELTIPLKGVTDSKTRHENYDAIQAIIDAVLPKELSRSVNYDRDEINVILDYNKGAYNKEALQAVINAYEQLAKKGLTAEDSIEMNYVQFTQTGDDIAKNLTAIKTREYGTEQEEQSERTTLIDPTRQTIGVGYLASLAQRKLAGEKGIEDEIRKVFGEYNAPLQSARASYVSASLSDAVQASFDDEVSDIIQGLVNNRENTKKGDLEAVDDLIINVANWIKGNRASIATLGSEDALTQMFQKTGASTEEAQKITDVIAKKLKELDIC